ncbi:MAG: DUF4251 domain-containing protein [Methanosarcina sp.]
MKAFASKLGIVLLTLGILWTPYMASSQDFQNNTKLTKKEKKEARRAELYANYQAIDTLLQRKQFVLEADYLQGKYGSEIPVTSNLNFIRVDGSNAILQTGANTSFGYNGVGGVTAEGNLVNYRVSKDPKRMSYVVMFTTTTHIGTYDVILRISADATARATITGLTNGSLTYRGNLVATYNSRTFKGQRTL